MTKSSATDGEIGILARRKIEAGIIAPIYRTMVEHIGKEQAQKILDQAISQAAIDAGANFAAKTEGGTSLKTFQDLQVLWTADDALVIDVVTATDTEFEYHVHRCRYAETYQAMGLGDIGHLLSCNRDGVFCWAVIPDQIATHAALMEGASHCDFKYTFDPSAEKPALK